MASSRHAGLVIALIAVAVAAAVAVAVIVVGAHRSAPTAPAVTPATAVTPPVAPTSLPAVGEAVYRYGVGPDGAPIPRSESQSRPDSGMMGGGMGGMGGMMRLSCATCHGTDAHGRTTQRFTSPNITYANLTDPKGMVAPDGTRGPTYSDTSLRRAITTGIDPTGSRLDWPMPQWQLTDREWAGLLAYLKTLR